MFDEISSSLAEFGVVFDVYFSERTLHETGALEKAIARLREQGHVYEADGAVWLRTTDFGDDKDRVLVKGDGEPTYFAADCAYYLDKRERGFDKVVIMLGADHTGYVGRYKALVAAMGDDPDEPPRDPDRPAGQPGARRRAGADEQAGRQRRQPGRPGRGDRRRRRPLRPGPGLDRPADRPRPRPVEPADQRQPGLLRAVRARPDLLGAAQRRRPRPRARRRGATSTSRCSATSGRTTCCGRSASSRGCSPPPPSCARRTGWPATWRSWPAPTTGSTTPAGCCRAATRRPTALTTARLWLCAATADGAAQRPRPCSACTPRSGCEGAPGRAAARRTSPSRRPPARPPARPRRARPARLAAVGASGSTASCTSAAGRSPSSPASTAPRCSCSTRATSAAGPPSFADGLRRRRRALRVQGVPLRPGGPLDRRRRPAPRRLQRQRARPGAGRRLPGRADRAARQQQVAGRAAAGRRRRASGTSSSTPSTRSTGWCRSPRPGSPPAARRCRCSSAPPSASRRTPTSSSPPPTRTRSSASRWPPATR